jgi:membrane fusion protein (multidrug efflux system)
MKRAFALTLVFLILAGLTAGLAWFHFVYKPEMIRGFIAAAPQPVATVAVGEAKQEEWLPRAPAIGTFRAVKGVDVAPQVGGVIVNIAFESGQDAKEGAALVQIDDTVEQADLKANLAALRNAELALERQRALVGSAATTKANLDSATAARDQAQAQVDRTRALISQKKIVAPFSGRLGLRRVDVGQYVSPGTPLVTLQQLDPMFIDFPMPEQRLGDLKVGQSVEVEVDAYPGHTFKGKIGSIDARVSAETRNVLVRGEIENNDQKLRPGMFGNVAVLMGAARTVVGGPPPAGGVELEGAYV